ncbi:hypothetical protein RZS08_14600, partial [Arthrospira platensis SPKY1]|nr:hypothetical protein [Arthrospira platensis SPKY1]
RVHVGQDGGGSTAVQAQHLHPLVQVVADLHLGHRQPHAGRVRNPQRRQQLVRARRPRARRAHQFRHVEGEILALGRPVHHVQHVLNRKTARPQPARGVQQARARHEQHGCRDQPARQQSAARTQPIVRAA